MQMTMRCGCGAVECEVTGPPILGAVCYCDDCQAGAKQIEALPGAVAVHGADGGTPYLLYRKDRVACVKGAEHLTGYKLKDGSPSTRMVAGCCNTALYFDFSKGHWLSVYRDRLPEAPGPSVRVCTKFAPDKAAIPGDLSSYATYPLSFVGKLLGARFAMLVGR